MSARFFVVATAVAFLCAGPAVEADAQVDSVLVTPGAQYAPRSPLHEKLLGSRYRDLWVTAIRVPLLDLQKFAGGLTPVRPGGSLQTVSLRLRGADGREYNFRSVDKDVAMPAFTRGTFVDWLRQDQTSAQVPSGPVLATALLDAVGILNPGPRLVVMPDDPGLGEFRRTFAGMLGTLEVHPDEGENGEPLFAGSAVVAGTDRLLEHLEEDPDHRVNSREFLRARLMDVFLGDYDRHGGQWRWARYERDGTYWWVPVPEDRDYAFVAYDGLLLDVARSSGIGRLIEFGDEYPNLVHMVANSLPLTRYLVSDLTWDDWEGVVNELEERLTDQVLRDAVETLPAPHFALRGEELFGRLRARRDRLRPMARELYGLLSHVVEIHGTDEDDRVEIDRYDDGGVEVRLYARGAEPARYQRRLEPEITREVRVFLQGGDDEAIVRGAGAGIHVHVIGGGSDDTFIDRSAGPTFFYDDRGNNRFVAGRRTRIDERPWSEPPMVPADEEEDETEEESARAETAGSFLGTAAEETDLDDLLPSRRRDWGTSSSWLSADLDWEPHAQLVVGLGPRLTRYGYRFAPYHARFWARGLYAPLRSRFGVELGADLRRSNSSAHLTIGGVASNFEASVFHGFGNDTPAGERVRAWRRQARLTADLYLSDTERLRVRVGPLAEYIAPETEGLEAVPAPSRDRPALGRVGARLEARLDTREQRAFPRRGFVIGLKAAGFGIGASRSEFVRTELAGSTLLPVPVGVLALRAGIRGVFGEFPYYDAVFVGGSETLRGHHYQRFTGDRAAFGGASLRMPIAPLTLLVHGTLGASVFADAGRVWFEGDSPGGWHTAIGGGFWFQVPVGAVSLSYARGEHHRLYFRFRLPY